jgi:hypothetical protein
MIKLHLHMSGRILCRQNLAPHLMPKHSFDPPEFRQDEMSRVTLPAQ